jgi:hypothetical protein
LFLSFYVFGRMFCGEGASKFFLKNRFFSRPTLCGGMGFWPLCGRQRKSGDAMESWGKIGGEFGM